MFENNFSVVVVPDEKAGIKSTKTSEAVRRGIPVITLSKFLKKIGSTHPKKKSPSSVPENWGFVNLKYDKQLTKIAKVFAKEIKSKRHDDILIMTKSFLRAYLSMDCPDEDVTDTVITALMI